MILHFQKEIDLIMYIIFKQIKSKFKSFHFDKFLIR